MSVKIRLSRVGAKNNPHYRVIVKSTKSKRDGDSIEILGYYNPQSKETKFDFERIDYWVSVGAKPTKTVERLLKLRNIKGDSSNKTQKKNDLETQKTAPNSTP
jgi:small subunit ribosomal protein S16